MNDPTMWASFVAALEPFGWAEYVHDGGYLSGDSLRHAESGAWARVTIKGDTLVTDGYPNDRSTKVRRFRDGTNDWPTTAKVWAEKIGAQKVADRLAYDAQQAHKEALRDRVRAIGEDLAAHLRAQRPVSGPEYGAGASVRTAGDGTAATVHPYWPGSVYGTVRIYVTDMDTLPSVSMSDVSGSDLAGIIAMVAAVERWQESGKGATN